MLRVGGVGYATGMAASLASPCLPPALHLGLSRPMRSVVLLGSRILGHGRTWPREGAALRAAALSSKAQAPRAASAEVSQVGGAQGSALAPGGGRSPAPGRRGAQGSRWPGDRLAALA